MGTNLMKLIMEQMKNEIFTKMDETAKKQDHNFKTNLKNIQNPADPSMKNLNAANILSLPRIPGKIKQKPSIIAANINKSGKNIGSNMTGVRLSAKKNGNSALCSIFVSVKMYFLSKIVFFQVSW